MENNDVATTTISHQEQIVESEDHKSLKCRRW